MCSATARPRAIAPEPTRPAATGNSANSRRNSLWRANIARGMKFSTREFGSGLSVPTFVMCSKSTSRPARVRHQNVREFRAGTGGFDGSCRTPSCRDEFRAGRSRWHSRWIGRGRATRGRCCEAHRRGDERLRRCGAMETPWSMLQLAYSAGYAMWTYLSEPYSLTFPGIETEELAVWNENGQKWRRLVVQIRLRSQHTVPVKRCTSTPTGGYDGATTRSTSRSADDGSYQLTGRCLIP
jgi:hypothetical protein